MEQVLMGLGNFSRMQLMIPNTQERIAPAEKYYKLFMII